MSGNVCCGMGSGASKNTVHVHIPQPIVEPVTKHQHVTFADAVKQVISNGMTNNSKDKTSDAQQCTVTCSLKFKSILKHDSSGLTVSQKQDEWTQYQLESLNAHNLLRYKHGVEPLTLNQKLCNMAKNYADDLIKRKAFEYCQGDKIMYDGLSCGQNIAATGSIGILGYPGHVAVHQWYAEGSEFKYNNPQSASSCESFTQLLWEDTKEFGQASACIKKGAWKHYVAVALYYPPGNTEGHVKVKPPMWTYSKH